jgi:uncharacterized protein YutE (UPF0331/DUF86 family)
MARRPHRVVRSAQSKLADLRQHLAELRALFATANPGFGDQEEKWRAVERVIEVVVEAGIDVAGLLITLHAARPPQVSKATFHGLVPLRIVNTDLADRLADHVGLRNRFVHEYEVVGPSEVYDKTPAVLSDFEEFRGLATAALATWRESHRPDPLVSEDS